MSRRLIIVLAIAALLLAAELLVRVSGYTAYLDPGEFGTSALFSSDTLLGYGTRPGLIELPTPESPDEWISIRHNADGERAVEPADNYLEDGPRREMWCVGGSQMYGLGLADVDTLPWMLYAAVKDSLGSLITIRNKAVAGYSPAEVYLMLRRAIEWGERPNLVVLPTSYVITNRTRRGRYELQRMLGRQPYMRPDLLSLDPLDVRYRSMAYRPIFLSRYFALPNLVDTALRNADHPVTDDKIVNETLRLLVEHDIAVVLLGRVGSKFDSLRDAGSGNTMIARVDVTENQSSESVVEGLIRAIADIDVAADARVGDVLDR